MGWNVYTNGTTKYDKLQKLLEEIGFTLSEDIK